MRASVPIPLPIFFLALFCAMPLAAQTYTFTHSVPTKGTTRKEAGTMKMSLGFSVEEGAESSEMTFGSTVRYKKAETVMEAGDRAWKKLRVVYDEYDLKDESPMGAGQADKPQPVTGVAYMVERADSLLISREDARELTASERAFIDNDFSGTDMGNGLGSQLSGKNLKIGDLVPLTAETAAGFLSALPTSDSSGVREFSMRLREVKQMNGRECGVFDLVLDFFLDNEPAAMQMKMKGEATLEIATCWPLMIKMNGPIDFLVNTEGISLTGSGTMEAESNFEYMK